jgi:hypothetical protein
MRSSIICAPSGRLPASGSRPTNSIHRWSTRRPASVSRLQSDPEALRSRPDDAGATGEGRTRRPCRQSDGRDCARPAQAQATSGALNSPSSCDDARRIAPRTLRHGGRPRPAPARAATRCARCALPTQRVVGQHDHGHGIDKEACHESLARLSTHASSRRGYTPAPACRSLRPERCRVVRSGRCRRPRRAHRPGARAHGPTRRTNAAGSQNARGCGRSCVLFVEPGRRMAGHRNPREGPVCAGDAQRRFGGGGDGFATFPLATRRARAGLDSRCTASISASAIGRAMRSTSRSGRPRMSFRITLGSMP